MCSGRFVPRVAKVRRSEARREHEIRLDRGTEKQGGHTLTEIQSVRLDTSEMAGVHKVFRMSLAGSAELVASAVGDGARREMVANYYENMIAFLAVHHNGEEELLFPLLSERVPEHKDLVEQAAREHAEIHSRVSSVNEHVESWRESGEEGAAGIVRALEDLAEVLVPHLDREEAVIMPMVAEHVTAEEWGMLPGHAFGNFGGDKIWLIMGLIRENFTEAQRATMLEHMPPPARDMWESMGERSFTELIGQVRAH